MIVPDFLGSGRREDLVDVLVSKRDLIEQRDLFETDGGRQKLNVLLDQIFNLAVNQRPLYLRWSQNIDGKVRNLSVPKKPLKQFIQGYLIPLIKDSEIHPNCHGGENFWSPERSLRNHLPCRGALSFDLNSAFESFSEEKVYGFYSGLLENTGITNQDEATRFLTEISIVTYGRSKGLPVGAEFSMPLFNRALYDLDRTLTENSQQRGLRYTRWVDDITISSPETKSLGSFLGAVKLVDSKHPVSRTKVFFQENDRDMYLLGQRISVDGRIFKNSKEERQQRKSPALDYEKTFEETNYGIWG